MPAPLRPRSGSTDASGWPSKRRRSQGGSKRPWAPCLPPSWWAGPGCGRETAAWGPKELESFAAAELVDIPHEVDVAHCDPGSEILERSLAWQADLICMATHGHGGLERLFLGSTAEKVVRSASCPVLTVRSLATSK